MGNKINVLFLSGVCLSLFNIFLSCEVYPRIKYQPLNTNGKRQTSVSRNISSYNEIINNNSILYLEFTQVGNRFYNQISISLYSLNRYNLLKIHNLEFEFDNQRKIIKLNKLLKLKQNPILFVVEDNNDLIIETYHQYIFYDNNSIKLYLQNVFKKNINNIGENFDLILNINYSLDNGNIKTQKIKYIVSVYKGRPDRPEWMYRLFPGM